MHGVRLLGTLEYLVGQMGQGGALNILFLLLHIFLHGHISYQAFLAIDKFTKMMQAKKGHNGQIRVLN